MSAPPLTSRDSRHWAFHVPANAAVSFVLAYGSNWNTTQAVIGMLAGIAAFVVFYASFVNDARFPRRTAPAGSFSRAFFYGTWLRSVLGLVSAPVLALSFSRPAGNDVYLAIFGLAIFPDMIAGAWAAGITTGVGRIAWVRSLRIWVGGPDAHQRAHNILVGDTNSLVPTFLITLAQGVLLSIILLAVSLVIFAILRCVALVKSWKRPGPASPPTLTSVASMPPSSDA